MVTLAGPATSSGTRSFALPLSFMGTGVVSFILLNLMFVHDGPTIAVSYFRNPHALIITHLFTLGFVTAVIMGAMYQLVPVILETPLWRPSAGFWSLGLYVPGVLTMLAGFWLAMDYLWLVAGGTLVLGAVLLFIWNIVGTMRAAPGWHIAATFLVGSLTYLSLVVIWGLLLAFNVKFGFFAAATRANLVTHVVLGFAGWFTHTILGVSYKLIPLFSLAHQSETGLARTLLVTLNLGILGTAAGAGLMAPDWVIGLGLVLMSVAILTFLYDTHQMLRTGVRRGMDLTARYGLSATCYLVLSLALAGALLAGSGSPSARHVAVIYAAGLGWVGMMVVGQMYKIVPFLVWTARYAPKAGREKVPILREMYAQAPANWGFWSLVPGVGLVVLGLWFGWMPVLNAGSVLVAAGAALFGYGMWQVYTR